MAQRVSKYTNELHSSIQEKINVQIILNLTNAVNLALKAEKMRQEDRL